jgi:hypothetical protein
MGVSGFMLKQPYLLYPLIDRLGVLNCDIFCILGIVQLKIYGIFSGVIYEDYILRGCVAMQLCRNLQMKLVVALKHL